MSNYNVISLQERMENWIHTFSSPDGRMKIFASNHGRFKFIIEGIRQPIVLTTVESVGMLSDLSKGMSDALDILYKH
jgi:hypothetical protein